MKKTNIQEKSKIMTALFQLENKFLVPDKYNNSKKNKGDLKITHPCLQKISKKKKNGRQSSMNT